MSITTSVKISDAKMSEPREIEGVPYYIANRSIVKACKPLSLLLFWSLKADSNNSTNFCTAQDKRTFEDQYEAYKDLKDYIKDMHSGDNPVPNASLETELAVLIPSAKEMRGYYNECWEIACQAVYDLLEIWLDSGENRQKSEISGATLEKVQSAERAVDRAMDMFLKGTHNKFPVKHALGELIPDADFDFERKIKPSPDAPKSGRSVMVHSES